MLNFKLAEAYVELKTLDGSYFTGLARAERAFARSAGNIAASMAKVTASFKGIAGAAKAVRGLQSDLQSLNRTLAGTVALARQAARALGSIPGGRASAGLAKVVVAQGKAAGWVIKAVGQGLGSVIRAAGSVAGSVSGKLISSALRSSGGGVASVVRSAGSAAASVVRSVGSASSQAIRATASVARASASVLSSVLRPAASMFHSVTGMMGKAGLVGGLVGGVGGGMTLGAVVDEAAKFESEMSRLRRSTGLEGAELAKLGDQLKGFARTMPGVDLKRVMETANFGARLGIEGKALALFTKDLSRVAAVLEEIPADEAAQRMMRLLTVFHKGSEDAIRLASSLNKLDLSSTANARDILDITTRLSGAASTLGMSPQKALALSTAMREAGVPVESAGTSMSQLLGRMASKRDMGAFARMAGVDKKTFANTLQSDPLAAVKAIASGLDRIGKTRGPIEAVRQLDNLHLDGQRVRGTLLQLMRVMGRLDAMVKDSEEEWRSMNSIMDGFNKVSETAKAQWQGMWNNIRVTAITIGTALLPVAKAAMKSVSELAQDIGAQFERNRGAIGEWVKVASARVREFGLSWKEWPTMLSIAWEKAKEFFGRFKFVAGNVWGRLKENAQTAWHNVANTAKNAFAGAARFVTDLFTQTAKHLGAVLHNEILGVLQQNWVSKALNLVAPGMAGALGGAKKVPVPGINPDFGLFGDPTQGNRQHVPLLGDIDQKEFVPGIGWVRRHQANVFAGMPNRARQLGPLQRKLADQRKARDEAVAKAAERDAADEAAQRNRMANRRPFDAVPIAGLPFAVPPAALFEGIRNKAARQRRFGRFMQKRKQNLDAAARRAARLAAHAPKEADIAMKAAAGVGALAGHVAGGSKATARDAADAIGRAVGSALGLKGTETLADAIARSIKAAGAMQARWN